MRGMTLVEVMVAVSIAAFLITGVSAAVQSTVRAVDAQKVDARVQEKRARAIELLRQDWRGRIRIPKPQTPPPGVQVLELITTSDGVGSSQRSSGHVTYRVNPDSTERIENGSKLILFSEPITLEYWDGQDWRREPSGAASAVKLNLQQPSETIILR